MMRPLSLRWLIPFTLVVLLLPACSDTADDSADTTLASTTTVEDQAVAVTKKDLMYATWEEGPLTLDMYAPAEPAGAPVVIFLPGGGLPNAPSWLVEGLVEEAAFVAVVRFARNRVGSPEAILSDHGAYVRAMGESVACAIHFARNSEVTNRPWC